jgi:mRNA-degrading endonuclease toxin of MazEF toxin-antitoxin module
VSVRRGEIWSYAPVIPRRGQSLARVIVSADALNETVVPVVLALHVVETDPENLLSVRLDPHGWALATTIEGTMKNRLGERQGSISEEEQEGIDRALRAVLDLDS